MTSHLVICSVLTTGLSYPGTVDVTVTYTPSAKVVPGSNTVQVLDIQYQVELVGDEVRLHNNLIFLKYHALTTDYYRLKRQ